MTQVRLHVYDVTNSESPQVNNTVAGFNAVTRDLGFGIFHGAVEVHGLEWSYGYCDYGTGIYSCESKRNPMYTFRETVELGDTPLSKRQVEAIIYKLRDQWPGQGYDLLTNNCCHFCDMLSREIGTGPCPAWVNRLAHGANSTVAFTNATVNGIQAIGKDLQRTCQLTGNFFSRLFAPLSKNAKEHSSPSASTSARSASPRPADATSSAGETLVYESPRAAAGAAAAARVGSLYPSPKHK